MADEYDSAAAFLGSLGPRRRTAEMRRRREAERKKREEQIKKMGPLSFERLPIVEKLRDEAAHHQRLMAEDPPMQSGWFDMVPYLSDEQAEAQGYSPVEAAFINKRAFDLNMMMPTAAPLAVKGIGKAKKVIGKAEPFVRRSRRGAWRPGDPTKKTKLKTKDYTDEQVDLDELLEKVGSSEKIPFLQRKDFTSVSKYKEATKNQSKEIEAALSKLKAANKPIPQHLVELQKNNDKNILNLLDEEMIQSEHIRRSKGVRPLDTERSWYDPKTITVQGGVEYPPGHTPVDFAKKFDMFQADVFRPLRLQKFGVGSDVSAADLKKMKQGLQERAEIPGVAASPDRAGLAFGRKHVPYSSDPKQPYLADLEFAFEQRPYGTLRQKPLERPLTDLEINALKRKVQDYEIKAKTRRAEGFRGLSFSDRTKAKRLQNLLDEIED